MTAVQKQALLAIATAATALAASSAALAASFDEPSTPDKPVSPPAKKKEPPAAAPAAATPPAAAPAAATPPAAATSPANGDDIQAQCRKAAKSYAEVYGREGLKEVLSKFTTGTLADVSADKLPELLKALS